MINTKKFKAILIDKQSTIENLANALCVDKSTIYRRIQKNGDSFTIKEVSIIAKELNLSKQEIIAIFFTNIVA